MAELHNTSTPHEHLVQEDFVVGGYNNGDLKFKGRLFSEGSFYDEDNGILTRMRLFVLAEKSLVYSVVSGAGEDKERRCYVLSMENDFCKINNGITKIVLPVEMLFTAVCGLCGLSDEHEDELKETFEEAMLSIVA